MPEVTLDTCPYCGRGLPPAPTDGSATRCPDCGFPFDPNTRVWRSAESWPRLALLYMALGLAVGLLVVLVERVGLGRARNPALALVWALLAPAIGLPVRRLLGGWITGRFVALTPPGIVVGTRGRPRLIPWSDVHRLVERRGVPRLELHSSPVPVTLDDIFPGAADLADFRAALVDRLASRDP